VVSTRRRVISCRKTSRVSCGVDSGGSRSAQKAAMEILRAIVQPHHFRSTLQVFPKSSAARRQFGNLLETIQGEP
jgi:hypothetical protein